MNQRTSTFVGSLSGMLAALSIAACDQPTTAPPAPSRSVAPAPVQNAIVSGMVWRHDASGDVTPYGGVAVWGWVERARSGYSIGTQAGADGRYSFTVPIGALIRVKAGAEYQPCVAALTVSGDADRDVHIVVDTARLGAHLPPELLSDAPTLSGLVFENTAGGRRAVPAVRVDLDMLSGMGDVSAATLTDSDGRYVLCGLGGATSTYVSASKPGFQLADIGMVDLSGNTVRDIELHR